MKARHINYIETGTITFTNSESETVTFSEPYSRTPVATLTSKTEDVNAYISSISATAMTVMLSQKITATVDYHIFGLE